jgi:hypothetical protein
MRAILSSSNTRINEGLPLSQLDSHFSDSRNRLQTNTDALQIPGRALNNRKHHFSSNPDILDGVSEGSPIDSPLATHHGQIQAIRERQGTNLLSASPPTGYYSERRNSEIPIRLMNASSGNKRDRLEVETSKSPRRTASFNNVSKPLMYQNSTAIDQDLLKDFVPNRFNKAKH